MKSQNPSTSRQWKTCHLVVFTLVIAAFSPWWCGGKVLAPLDIVTQLMVPWRQSAISPQVHNHFISDAVTQYLPYRWLAQESFQRDGFIGWSNLTGGGINQYANTMARYFDWSVQLYRWFDFWTAWHLALIGQLLLAGCGMLVFLRSAKIGPGASLAATIAFLLNFQFLAWLYWSLSSFCWVPWVLWALHRWREKKKWMGLLASMLLALGFCGSTLQYAAFIVLAVAAFGLAWMIQEYRQPRQLLRTAGAVLAITLAGIVLASPMFIPSIRLFWESQQAHSRGQLGYREGWLQPLLNFVSYFAYLFPHPMGAPASMDGWKLLKSDLFNIGYFGVLPLGVAVAAAASRRFPMEARLLMWIGFLIPLTPLVGPLYHRVSLVGIVGGVWLFAHALERERPWLNHLLRRLLPFLLGILAVWLLTSILIRWQREPLAAVVNARILSHAANSAYGCLTEWLSSRGNLWLEGLLIWSWSNVIPLMAVGVAIYLLLRPQPAAWHGFAISALLAVEMGMFAGRWIGFCTVAQTRPFPETEETQALRRFVTSQGMVHIPGEWGCRLPFPQNTLSVYGVRTWDVYESIRPRGMTEHLGSNPSAYRLALCGVTHLVLTPDKPAPGSEWVEVWRNQKIVLYAITAPWPRYTALPTNTTWSVEHPVRLPETVEVLAETQNRRLLRLPPATGSLRIAENWSANWEYTLDGKTWWPAQCASDASLLLPVTRPAADGIVQLRYQPRWFITHLGVP